MSDFARFDLPDGGYLLVEANEALAAGEGEPERDMGLFDDSKVREARQSLTESLQAFVPAAGVLLQQLRALAPDELTVEMGVVLSAELGIAIAKASGSGHLQITLKWDGKGE